MVVHSAVGLILGGDVLVASQVSREGRRLRRLRQWRLPATDREVRRESLRRVVAEAGQPVSWAVGVSGQRIGSRRLAFPFRDRTAISRSLPYALEDHVPEDVESLTVTWLTLRVGSETEVLALSIATHELAELLQELRQVGIDPPHVVPADLAAWFAFRAELGDAWVWDATLGPAALVAFRNGIPVARHVFEAEHNAASFRRVWLSMLRQTGGEPTRLLAAGSVPDAARSLEPAVMVQPLPPLPDMLGDYDAATALAVLALRPGAAPSLNLRIGPLAHRSEQVRLRKPLALAAGLAGLSLVLWLGQLGLRYWHLEEQLRDYREQSLAVFRQISPGARAVNIPLQLRQRLERVKGQASDEAHGTRPLRVLLSVLDAVPEGAQMRLQRVEYAPPLLTLEGVLPAREWLERWGEAIRASPHFTAVSVTPLGGEAGGHSPFRLSLKLRPTLTATSALVRYPGGQPGLPTLSESQGGSRQ